MKRCCLMCTILLFSCGAFAGTARILDAVTSGLPTPRLTGPQIEAALKQDSRTHNLYVTADTHEGLVILHGTVNSYPQRDAVLNVVSNVPNVDRVFNFVQVNRDPYGFVPMLSEGYRDNVSQSNMNDRSVVA